MKKRKIVSRIIMRGVMQALLPVTTFVIMGIVIRPQLHGQKTDGERQSGPPAAPIIRRIRAIPVTQDIMTATMAEAVAESGIMGIGTDAGMSAETAMIETGAIIVMTGGAAATTSVVSSRRRK